MAEFEPFNVMSDGFTQWTFGPNGERLDERPALRFTLPTIANEKTRAALLDIIGHLGAILIQTIPSDDDIIIEHVRAAHRIACEARREIK